MAEQEKTNALVINPPRSKISQPVLHRAILLHTMQAQRVADRSLDRVSYGLFSIELILQIIGQREDIDEVEESISTRVGTIHTDMTDELSRLEEVQKAHGLEPDDCPVYTSEATREVYITSPLTMQFMELIGLLDKIVIHLDMLWLNGKATNRAHVNSTFEWQQRLNKLATFIISLETRSRKRAQEVGKSEQVKSVAPEKDKGGGKPLEKETPQKAPPEPSKNSTTTPDQKEKIAENPEPEKATPAKETSGVDTQQEAVRA